MTPKTTIDEFIPGNSLLSRHQQARISKKSNLMKRQTRVFEDATAIRTKSKTSKTLHKAITISTYNVHTLKQTGKLHQLLYGCTENNTDLVAIQEHRWQKQEQISTYYSTLNNTTWCFEYSSATPEG